MKSKIIVLLVLLLSMPFITTDVQAKSSLKIDSIIPQEQIDLISQQAILIDLSDQKVLYEKAADEHIHPASMTKIMSVLVAIEHIDNLDEKMVMSEDVFEGLFEANASVVGFREGEKVSMKDLLYASLVASGADASRALAIHISGSEESFVSLMNKKAKELGLKDTHFMNVTGLDDDQHYSSVRDIAKILEKAIQNKTFEKIYKTRHYEIKANNIRQTPISLSSTLLKHLSNLGYEDNVIVGGKTGYTEDGGLCLASTAKHDGTFYLAVTANGGTDSQSANNLKDAYMLYHYFFDHYERKTILKKQEEYLTLPVKWNFSNQEMVLSADQKLVTLVPKNIKKEDITVRFIGDKTVKTPIEKNQLLGQVEFVYGSELLASFSLRAPKDIGRNPILYYGEPIFAFFQSNPWATVLLIGVIFSFIVWLIWRKKYRRYL